MNPLTALQGFGQSVWLDFLARSFIADGSLERLVKEDGLRGVTSNPAIFEKAITHGGDYRDALRAFVERQDAPVAAIYEHLAIEDIRAAADVLRPVYEATAGRDGYVSLEVSPYLALATDDTVEEARRLWRTVDRPNLMVKVPATPQGLPAIRRLTGVGVNVNITLLFSQEVYEQVADAYISGLEDLVARGGDPSRAASVASFFVSRIDTAVDKLLDERRRGANDAEARTVIESLKGKVAIANARLAYRRYQRLFSGARWEALQAKGARTQRLLWASTGTKDPEASEVLYVEALVAPFTINTMPDKTLLAFAERGQVGEPLPADGGDAGQVLAEYEAAGIEVAGLAARLQHEGAETFDASWNELMQSIETKSRKLAATG
jgi:transaldolase / glucose-6-phosphate isomerase